MWPESSAIDLDLEADRPLWDLDPKDPSCAWNLDLSQQLAAKLLMAGGVEDPGFDAGPDQQPPLLGTAAMSDTTNPYALLNQIQDTSVHMNTTAEGASGTANPRFKTEICRNFKEKGTCLYGELCQFAHGKHELRVSSSVRRDIRFTTFVYSAEGLCSAQQIQDQALSEVLDCRILRVWTKMQLHPPGEGEPEELWDDCNCWRSFEKRSNYAHCVFQVSLYLFKSDNASF